MTIDTIKNHNTGRLVGGIRIEELTNSNWGVIYSVPAGAGIKLHPVSPGEAVIYSTQSPIGAVREAVNVAPASAFPPSVFANEPALWDIWGAGNVTEQTIQQVNLPLVAVAAIIISGEWLMEISYQ